MMRIRHILNNNAAVVEMDDGSDAIAMCSGIGFSLKKGDLVPKSMGPKVYKVQNSKHQALINLIENMDPLYLDISDKIVKSAEEAIGQEYSPFLTIELADHIALALSRWNKGINLTNLLADEAKTMYATEYAIGNQALNWIKDKTGIALNEAEAGFIAMHLISSRVKQQKVDRENQQLILIEGILSLINEYYGLVLQKDQILHTRFWRHLNFLALRILQREPMDSQKMAELYNSMPLTDVDRVFEERLQSFIKRKYRYNLCEDELFYVLIHLRAVLE